MEDRQLVLTGVGYSSVDTLFKQMATSLKKFLGQQAAWCKEMECGIKEELALQASEDVNYSRNCFRRNSGLGEIIILVTIVDKKKITHPSIKPLIQKDLMVYPWDV